jgi:hypothetical protein
MHIALVANENSPARATNKANPNPADRRKSRENRGCGRTVDFFIDPALKSNSEKRSIFVSSAASLHSIGIGVGSLTLLVFTLPPSRNWP